MWTHQSAKKHVGTFASNWERALCMCRSHCRHAAAMKRGREEFESTQQLVKVEAAVNVLVSRVSLWKDLCGCQYQFYKKLDKQAQAATLKLGPFDEIRSSAILELVNMKLPGDYAIADYSVDVEKKALCFSITRGATDIALKKAVTFKPSNNDDEDLDYKTRLARAEDTDEVKRALAIVTKGCGNNEWSVKELPATYAVRIKFRTCVPASALKASAGYPESKMDFDTGTLVCFVPKLHPDIV